MRDYVLITRSNKHTLLCLKPNIEVCVDTHHESSNSTSRFKEQYPSSVEKQKDSEDKLNCTTSCFDIIDIVIQRFPKSCSKGIDHEEDINHKTYDNL